MRSRRRRSWWPYQVLAFLIAGGAWQLASVLLPANTVASPLSVLALLSRLLGTVDFWSAIGQTVGTFVASLAVCVAVGVPVGLLIGSNVVVTQSTRLVLDFVRTIPPIAILPLLLLIFGAKPEMVVILAIAGGIWPILVQSIYAARQGEPLLDEMASAFAISRGAFIRHIFLPGALPFIMTGLRLGTTICLLLTVTGELLGGAPGIGFEIANAQAFYDNPRVYAFVLVSGVLGLGINTALWAAQRRVLHWHPSFRGREAT